MPTSSELDPVASWLGDDRPPPPTGNHCGYDDDFYDEYYSCMVGYGDTYQGRYARRYELDDSRESPAAVRSPEMRLTSPDDVELIDQFTAQFVAAREALKRLHDQFPVFTPLTLPLDEDVDRRCVDRWFDDGGSVGLVDY